MRRSRVPRREWKGGEEEEEPSPAPRMEGKGGTHLEGELEGLAGDGRVGGAGGLRHQSIDQSINSVSQGSESSRPIIIMYCTHRAAAGGDGGAREGGEQPERRGRP